MNMTNEVCGNPDSRVWSSAFWLKSPLHAFILFFSVNCGIYCHLCVSLLWGIRFHQDEISSHLATQFIKLPCRNVTSMIPWELTACVTDKAQTVYQFLQPTLGLISHDNRDLAAFDSIAEVKRCWVAVSWVLQSFRGLVLVVGISLIDT